MIPSEEKYIWLDEDGDICSPLHNTLGAAIRRKGTWKPSDGDSHYSKVHGSGNRPRTLRKVIISYELVEDETTRNITDAFRVSDLQETES